MKKKERKWGDEGIGNCDECGLPVLLCTLCYEAACWEAHLLYEKGQEKQMKKYRVLIGNEYREDIKQILKQD